MNKLCKVIVMVILLFSISLITLTNKVEGKTLFPDTKDYRKEIVYLAGRGIIKGYENGNFGPNDPIKRVQAVQMIIRELGIRTGDAPNPHFKDVPPGSYGYNEIAKAAQLGIISGKGDGSFDPNGKLTRGQMAKILVNAYKLKGTYYADFKDVSAKDARYPYIQTLAAHHITTGFEDGTFRPNEILKRAHFAVFMARLLNDHYKPNNMEKSPTQNAKQIAKNAQSVVAIELYDENDELVSQGSGFIVANQLIATNFFGVSGGSKAVAITDSGDEIELEGVVAYDEYLDVAILKPTEKIGYPSLPLSSFSSVKTGEKVVAIGSPIWLENNISEGVIVGAENFEDENGSLKAIQTTADIKGENIGGPLINMKGFVVGLNLFGSEDGNFAISSDYINHFLADFKGVDFHKIQTKNFTDMPVFDDEGEKETDEDGMVEKIPTPIDLEPLKGNKQMISEHLIDAVHDPELPVVYGINEYGELVSVNHDTKSIKKLPFNYPAEKIFYNNGELFITLIKEKNSSVWLDDSQEGAVAVVDPLTWKVKNIFDINIQPYDIVADDNHFYVSSGTGQWTTLKSFNKKTGIEVSSQRIREASSIVIHPSKDRIYAVDSDQSPRDMVVFPIQNGVLLSGYDSPYHGDYELATNMTISPDGKYIFNHEGTTFLSSRLHATNMHFVTDLNARFEDITFNNELTKFYLAIANRIYVYNYENFMPIKTYSLDGEGSFLFTFKGSLVVIGKEKTSNSNVFNTFILKSAVQ